MKCTVQNGFTLIELMIVVAIIGILASIALPAYQDYTIRSHVSEPMLVFSSSKVDLYEDYHTSGSMPLATDPSVANQKLAFQSSQYVTTATYTRTSTTQAQWELQLNNLGSQADGDTFITTYTANAQGIFMDCTGGTLDAKYRPANCRP